MNALWSLVLFLILPCASRVLADTPMPGMVAPGTAVECPSELSEWDLQQLRALQASGVYDSIDPDRVTGSYLVYLAFHVVRTTAGTGGILQSQLDQAMLDLEDAFAGTGICFLVAHQDTINSDAYYSIDSDAERNLLRSIANQPDMIDCYFVNHDEGYCGVSSFSWSTVHGISFDMQCVGVPDNPSTFPHEIGHYFDLLHTHSTGEGEECPNGSNCAVAGDLVCDTPADPGLGAENVNQDCVYTGNETRFCGLANRPFAPDPTNLMSYSLKTCRTNFTPGQKARMLSTLVNTSRWGEIGFNAPDFDFSTPFGWSNALVPRDNASASPASCIVSATLPGNVSGTWLNQAVRQSSSDSHNPGAYGRIFLDNEWISFYYLPEGTWEGQQYLNNVGPWPVRGGRHALQSVVDYHDAICEQNEIDNLRSVQWVWSPYPLAAGQSVQRNTPPEKMSNLFTWPNSDGFQFSGTEGWSAVAIQPLSTSADYDLHLHNNYTGSAVGFSSTWQVSSYGSGEPDWVLVNHHSAPAGNWQAGVVNYDGESASFRIAERDSRAVQQGDGTRICGSIAANEILDLVEVYFSSSEIAQGWTVTLSSDDGVDLDLYLYSPISPTHARNGYLKTSQTANTPAESMTLLANTDLPEAGWYAFVVAKDGSQELAQSCSWELKFVQTGNRLTISAPTPVQVAVFQDGAPYGSTEWTDQLSAMNVPYTLYTTTSLSWVDLDAFGAVIVPSPGSEASHNSIQGNMARLNGYNLRGGVLVLGTAFGTATADFTVAGGVQASWSPCNTAHPIDHLLVGGVAPDAQGNAAVRHTLAAPGAGWTSLASSDCGGASCMLLNEELGLLVYGAPMEHSLLNFDCSLGESIENIVAWATKRARQTLRIGTTPLHQPIPVVFSYSKSPAASLSYTNSESLGWLSVSPASGSIPLFSSSAPITFTVTPASTPGGIHRGTVRVAHSMINSPELVYAVMTLPGAAPAAPLNLVMTPLDFSPGHATVLVDWTPVTTDINGQPLTIESYRLWYDDTWPMSNPAGIDVPGPPQTLHYENVGILSQGFLRVTATDVDGQVVADSQPGEPLPVSTGKGDASLFEERTPGSKR
ncbi:MAG: hypothetical protein H6678_11180 [Candidatus Delongbacteria bacterium]|nr:hypothetical protein [Candidatus Delongbacteria bacterium]